MPLPQWVLKATISPATTGSPSDAVSGNGIAVFVGANTITSADGGETWAENTGGRSSLAGLGANITFGEGTFVSTEPAGTAGNDEQAWYSTNGTSWTKDTSGFSGAGYNISHWFPAYEPVNNMFFAVNQYEADAVLGLRAGKTSSNGGVTWSNVINLPANVGWSGVAWGNDTFVIITKNTIFYTEPPTSVPVTGQVMTSPDAVVFTYRTAAAVKTWRDVCYAGMKPGSGATFVAVSSSSGTTGKIMVSNDSGATWHSVNASRDLALTRCASDGAGTIIAVGPDDNIAMVGSMISQDYGETWTDLTQDTDTLTGFSAVTWISGNLWAASGVHILNNGQIQMFTLDLTEPEPPPPDPDPDPDPAPDEPGSSVMGGRPINQTWLYDGATGFWSKLKSQYITRHRVQFAFQCAGKTIGADYADGKLYRITDTALSDNGKSIEGEIIGETLALPDQSFLTVNRLRVTMETGVGTTVGQGSNPQISLSLSRDNGHTWGAEMWKTVGAAGEYQTIVEWRRLGTTRWLTPKLRITDPVKRVIIGASINPED